MPKVIRLGDWIRSLRSWVNAFLFDISPSDRNSIFTRRRDRHLVFLHKERTNLRGYRACGQATETSRVLERHSHDETRIVGGNGHRVIGDDGGQLAIGACTSAVLDFAAMR